MLFCCLCLSLLPSSSSTDGWVCWAPERPPYPVGGHTEEPSSCSTPGLPPGSSRALHAGLRRAFSLRVNPQNQHKAVPPLTISFPSLKKENDQSPAGFLGLRCWSLVIKLFSVSSLGEMTEVKGKDLVSRMRPCKGQRENLTSSH